MDLLPILFPNPPTRGITIEPYNDIWPQLFKKESERIYSALVGFYVGAIHHIGSTSIPGMAAKPIIDILIECYDLTNIEEMKKFLKTIKYDNLRRHVLRQYSYYGSRQGEDIAYSILLREIGDPQIKRLVNFKDYLTNHQEQAQAYVNLKKDLAKQYPDDIYYYVYGKDKLIKEIGIQAKQWPARRCNYLIPNRGQLMPYWSLSKINRAVEANWNIHMTHFAQFLEPVELLRMPGITLVKTNFTNINLNYIVETELSESQTKPIVNEVKNHFSKQDIPFTWWISPYDTPQNLTQLLQESGFKHTESLTSMYIDLDAWQACNPPSDELTVTLATTDKVLQDYASDDEKNYYALIAKLLDDDDPFEYYVAYHNDNVVARAKLCILAGLVGIYDLPNSTEMEDNQFLHDLLQFCLTRAKSLGFHLSTVFATEDDLPFFQQYGFKECGHYHKFSL